MSDSTFQILPQQGLNGLPIGSSKADVRAFFGEGFQAFQRTPEAAVADYWRETAVFAYYQNEGRLEAIEITSPADVTLAGQSLLRASFDSAQRHLASLDESAEREPGGLRSDALGVAIWSSTGDGMRPVDSVLVYGPNYYSG
jgi:hypothetical protein